MHVQVEKDRLGCDDLMKEVLGPEHPGRTREVGYNISLKESGINERKRKKYELPEFDDLKEKLEESLSESIYDKIQTNLVTEMVIKVMEVMGDVIESMVATRVEAAMMQPDVGRNEDVNVTSPQLKRTSVTSIPTVGRNEDVNVTGPPLNRTSVTSMPTLDELDQIKVCVFFYLRLPTSLICFMSNS